MAASFEKASGIMFGVRRFVLDYVCPTGLKLSLDKNPLLLLNNIPYAKVQGKLISERIVNLQIINPIKLNNQ